MLVKTIFLLIVDRKKASDTFSKTSIWRENGRMFYSFEPYKIIGLACRKKMIQLVDDDARSKKEKKGPEETKRQSSFIIPNRIFGRKFSFDTLYLK